MPGEDARLSILNIPESEFIRVNPWKRKLRINSIG